MFNVVEQRGIGVAVETGAKSAGGGKSEFAAFGVGYKWGLRRDRSDGERAAEDFEDGPCGFILDIHFLYETACGAACQPKEKK